MSRNLERAKSHLRAIEIAIDNVEHGRMTVDYLDTVFEGRVESIRNLIHGEAFTEGDKGGG